VFRVGISLPFASSHWGTARGGKRVTCNKLLDHIFVDRGSFEHFGARGYHGCEGEGFLGEEGESENGDRSKNGGES
jgi:hypothetical protein